MIYTLDIGGTLTKFAWFENGKIIKSDEWKTEQNADEMLDNIFRNAPKNPKAIGISSGGFWKNEKCVGYSSVKEFTDGVFIKILHNQFQCPVFIDNDARCALRAEYEFGSLQNNSSCALITLGTSLGCAIMFDGKIISGNSGQAGALFMMPEFYDGDKYFFDVTLNSLNVTKRYKDGAYYGDFKNVYDKAQNGEKEAKEYVSNYIKAVALKCFYLYLMFDIEAIAISGGIAEADGIIEGIKKELKRFLAMEESERVVNIHKSAFGNQANLIGAYILTKRDLS